MLQSIEWGKLGFFSVIFGLVSIANHVWLGLWLLDVFCVFGIVVCYILPHDGPIGLPPEMLRNRRIEERISAIEKVLNELTGCSE